MREFSIGIRRTKTTEEGEKYRQQIRDMRRRSKTALKFLSADEAAVWIEELTLDVDVPFEFYVGDDKVGYIMI